MCTAGSRCRRLAINLPSTVAATKKSAPHKHKHNCRACLHRRIPDEHEQKVVETGICTLEGKAQWITCSKTGMFKSIPLDYSGTSTRNRGEMQNICTADKPCWVR